MQQIPTPFRVMSMEESHVLVDWLIARRELLLEFLYQNRLVLQYDSQYVQLFLNELVRQWLNAVLTYSLN
jgi:hypothetical protein